MLQEKSAGGSHQGSRKSAFSCRFSRPASANRATVILVRALLHHRHTDCQLINLKGFFQKKLSASVGAQAEKAGKARTVFLMDADNLSLCVQEDVGKWTLTGSQPKANRPLGPGVNQSPCM